MIITIDGPSGSGKGTAAKGLAKRLGFHYCDTGAMYRAIAYYLTQRGVGVDEVVASDLENFSYRVTNGGYLVGEEDVSEVIRSLEITQKSSAYSAKKCVRQSAVAVQRKLAKSGNWIFEGRDLGTIVFPDADMKFYLTATPEVRARRRYLELTNKGVEVSEEEVLERQQKRDADDSTRALSPLTPAEDASVVDTSSMDVDEVIARLMEEIG